QAAHLLGFVPRAKHPSRVPPEDEEQLVARSQPLQLAKSVGREGRAGSAYLDIGDLERSVISDGEPRHLEPPLRVRHRGPAVRGASRGNKDQAIELSALDRGL